MSFFVPPPLPAAERMAEVRQEKANEANRTLQGNAQALLLDQTGAGKLWTAEAARMRGNVGGFKGFIGTVAMSAALATAGLLSQIAKREYKQPRPFQLDTTMAPIGGLPRDPSYPSGHAAASEAAATVLAHFDPAHADEYQGLASDVAAARVYSEVHLPSDVAAGSTLGARIGGWFS